MVDESTLKGLGRGALSLLTFGASEIPIGHMENYQIRERQNQNRQALQNALVPPAFIQADLQNTDPNIRANTQRMQQNSLLSALGKVAPREATAFATERAFPKPYSAVSDVGKRIQDYRKLAPTQQEIATAGRGKLSAAEEKIRRLKTALNIDEATAVGIVDGALKVVTDPVTGDTSIINIATGDMGTPEQMASTNDLLKEEGMPQIQEAAEPQYNTEVDALMQNPSFTLWDATSATGLKSGAKAAWAATFGQSFDIDEENTKKRYVLQHGVERMIDAFGSDGRISVDERNRLRGVFNIEPGLFTSERQIRARLQEINKDVNMEMKNAMRAASDKSLPVKKRAEARAKIDLLKNLKGKLGVPQGGANMPLKAINSGATPEQWERVTESERELFR